MKPLEKYLIFYYSHSEKPVDFTVKYTESYDKEPLFTELENGGNTILDFVRDEPTYFVHY